MSDMFAAAIEASKRKSSSSMWIEQDFLNVAKDRSASIKFEQFLQTHFAQNLSKEDAKAAFDRLDLDRNGDIDLKEWNAGLSALECQLNILNSGAQHASQNPVLKSDLALLSPDMPTDARSSMLSKSSFVSSDLNLKSGTMGAKHKTIRYKLIDLGTAIAVSDVASDNMATASASMMTFTAMDFAGLTIDHPCFKL
jgi:hypothetical protein